MAFIKYKFFLIPASLKNNITFTLLLAEDTDLLGVHPGVDLIADKVDVIFAEGVTEMVDMEDYENESIDSDDDEVLNFEVLCSDSESEEHY